MPEFVIVGIYSCEETVLNDPEVPLWTTMISDVYPTRNVFLLNHNLSSIVDNSSKVLFLILRTASQLNSQSSEFRLTDIY